jgi:undecaprenyl-diphosphatase
MVILQAIFLGIIEGLTEFLPISSTGHLLISEKAIGYHDAARIFTVVIQLGAIAAVIWYYRNDLISRTTGLFNGKKADVHFWKNLVIATIPAAVIGIGVDKLFGTKDLVGVVAVALILGGFVMLLAEKQFATKHIKNDADINGISAKQAFAVGCAQVLSLIPGVSRSGATIVGGMYAGLSRVTATAFSFYVSMPILIMASGYKLLKGKDDIATISGGGTALIAGSIAAFITALFAIKWLLKYVAHHDFKPFAYYRITLGVLLLLLFATGVITN